MKLQVISENNYSDLEDSDKFRSPGVDFLPVDRTLERIARDVLKLANDIENLRTDWNVRRAEAIVGYLRNQASLLQILSEKEY